MPLTQLFGFIGQRAPPNRYSVKLVGRVKEVTAATWYLGFTSFGGPPAHFQIFHKKFVKENEGRTPWIDERTYQELFALCQALPGPGSTKFLFVTVLAHAGWVPAILAFLIWSLPGAIGMFALSLGVRRISDTLPEPAYALLSGLNASTVGIIAVAAVQLAEKCIRDPLSRLLVIFGACAGVCYSALWYYPILIVCGGVSTLSWDLWLAREARKLKQTWEARRRRRRTVAGNEVAAEMATDGIDDARDETRSIELRAPEPVAAVDTVKNDTLPVHRRQVPSGSEGTATTNPGANANIASTWPSQGSIPAAHQQEEQQRATAEMSEPYYSVSVRVGLLALAVFAISFITILVTRSELPREYRPLSLFANMYLAGTIIFGGGPVVIPLLREYVVYPGWVSSRDFLIGLAIIQALPGPNFNFSVYLGALAVAGTGAASSAGNALLGGFLGFVGIFVPGLVFAFSVQGIWVRLRSRPLFLALLRGINATAVGLVFTAVYRLWEVGYLTSDSRIVGSAMDTRPTAGLSGRSLAEEPWWVVVAVLTYAGNKWFGVPAAVGIATGGVLGLGWWGATQR